MLEAIEFTNFKALRKTHLPLAPFTLLLGPNGSGKTSVLQALEAVALQAASQVGILRQGTSFFGMTGATQLSVTEQDRTAAMEFKLHLRLKDRPVVARFQWLPNGQVGIQVTNADGTAVPPSEQTPTLQWLARMQIYALDANVLAHPTPVNSGPLQSNGFGLAAVLDDLKDNHPENWQRLLEEMRQWLPEYDYILFDKPQQGSKGIVLRTKKGGHRIPARDLSQGTLIALALLTLAHLPNPASLLGMEEIDRGLHPRLLRQVQDALYRLTYPESGEESRPPIQVIGTTHSPYLLDLYREHPEEVVLAQKEGLEVQMKRLADFDHYEEIIGESPLSEVWYSGVLGGVSVKP